MDASYIPIAEAMGFTTHWIRSKSLKILYSFTAIPVLSDIQPLQISYVLLHSDVPDLRHSNVHRMLPEGNWYDVQLRFFHKQAADFWKRSQTLWKTPGHILPAILFLPGRSEPWEGLSLLVHIPGPDPAVLWFPFQLHLRMLRKQFCSHWFPASAWSHPPGHVFPEVYEKVTNQRNDFLQKQSTMLVRENQWSREP